MASIPHPEAILVSQETSYLAAIDYILNYADYERVRDVPYDGVAWDLARMRHLLAGLGNPQERTRFVHVAGSKGKGSTAAMIDAVLRANGRRTGLYTSPHLHTFRERIRVQGALLAPEALAALLTESRRAIEAVPGITTFEIITALALLHFARQEVDWAVLEVGLGGRLDATNVVEPALCVITPISLEHTALLGSTVAEIAGEKAGIIKPGVPVVVAPQPPEAMAVFREACRRQGCRLIDVAADWRWQATGESLDGQSFAIWPRDTRADDAQTAPGGAQFHIPLLGAHQLDNAATALAACRQLVSLGVPWGEEAARRGLAEVTWPGRLEVLCRPGTDGPALVVDSAHNGASAAALGAALDHHFPGMPRRLVVGVSSDKDLAALLQPMISQAQALVFVRSRHPRAADPRWLAGQAAGLGLSLPLVVAASVASGLDLALAQSEPGEVVCAWGSLFVAAEAREAWHRWHPESFAVSDWVRQADPANPWQIAQWPAVTASPAPEALRHGV